MRCRLKTTRKYNVVELTQLGLVYFFTNNKLNLKSGHFFEEAQAALHLNLYYPQNMTDN